MTRPLRIVYFHQHFSTPSGSAGTRSYEMARRLVAAGHHVTMVCGSYANGKTGLEEPFRHGRRQGFVDGIEVIEFDIAYGNRLSFVNRIGSFLKFALRSMAIAVTRPADVVFATTTPLTAALPGLAAKWLRRRPFVFEVRDLWPEIPRQMGIITNPAALAALEWLERAAYRSADRLVALSPGMVDGIARHGVSRDRIAMIPNGADLDIFAGSPEPWRPASVSAHDFMAIFTGTHGPANGLHAVIDAAGALQRRGARGIKLVLVGDGKVKAELQTRVAEEKLDEWVIFHPPVPKHRIAGLMAAADCGMQILADVPSFHRGTSPNKFFDYIAAGLPVLTNYPGWIAELITEAECGLAVAPGDAESFANALQTLAAGTGGEMRKRSRSLAMTQFAREDLGARFVDWVTAAAIRP